jgi:hypothetical protein
VQGEAALFGDAANRGDLIGAIDQAIFGRVCDRDCGWLHLVHIRTDAVAGRDDRFGVDLRPGPIEQHELAAAGKKAGRAGFVDLDMRVLVAQDGPIWRAQRAKSDAVSGGAGGHPESADFRLEQVGEGAVEPLAQRIAVVGGVDAVRGGDRRDYVGVRGRGIV